MEGLPCLQCGHPLEQDFGIVACTNCGAVMMIDMDGRVQLTEETVARDPEPAFVPTPVEEEPLENFEITQQRESPLPDSEPDPEPLDSESSSIWQPESPLFEEAPVEEVVAEEASGSFADVESFGNQDSEAAVLHFDLRLDGIDHADLRTQVLQILSDPRLSLNQKEVAASIQGGVLILNALNAARASLIVTRLQHLQLQISWKQRAYDV